MNDILKEFQSRKQPWNWKHVIIDKKVSFVAKKKVQITEKQQGTNNLVDFYFSGFSTIFLLMKA